MDTELSETELTKALGELKHLKFCLAREWLDSVYKERPELIGIPVRVFSPIFYGWLQ